VDQVLGLHISADIPLGQVNVAPGPFFAAPTAFDLEIRGRGGHAAAPHQTVDAVVVAAHVITALQTVVSRTTAPTDTAVLTVGKVEAGFRGNVIAESAKLHGTIRSYSEATLDVLMERSEAIIAGVCAAFGAEYTFNYNTSCPPVVNDEEVTAFVIGEACEFFGESAIIGAASMGADDMSDFLALRPGCYFWLGARNEAKGIAGRHHDSGFVIDEAALPLGAEFGTRLIERSLSL
jgi:amidohydrolase